MTKSGGLFDFNRDGKVSFGEQVLGMAAIMGVLSELENKKMQVELSARQDVFDDFDEIDHDEQDVFNIFDEIERDELELRLEELRDQRDELDFEEPDDLDSEAYDEWEDRCEEIDEQIEELEELLEG